jgi:hypothetical protein
MFTVAFKRRTLYGLVDRQFLPSTLRVFDFANPDLHIPQRSDTTVPQQALFFLNNELLLARAEALARRTEPSATPTERVQAMYQFAYQRPATDRQVVAALALIESAARQRDSEVPATARDWQFGVAAVDPNTRKVSNFQPLPHFTGQAWQGGPQWPDAKLGWAKLTAAGGHAGNDLNHAVVRRWTAPRDLTVRIESNLAHAIDEGDGVRGAIVSSSAGLLAAAAVHKSQATLNLSSVTLKRGETLDFVVDIGSTLNNDEFAWDITITNVGVANAAATWNSARDFRGPAPAEIDPWTQLAQVLFAANEFVFID